MPANMPQHPAMAASLSTFDSPKVAKARLPTRGAHRRPLFAQGGDIFDDRLVTFSTAVRPPISYKW